MEVQAWIESSIRAFFCLTGITGNLWLGLRSLPKSRSQLRPNDVLFINLAASNLITNCLVDLPDTLAQFVNDWFMGRNYCSVLQFSSDLSETSSIFSTMFISMYWHQKLVGSIRRGGAPVQMDNLRLVVILLAGSWIVALMFSVPHFFIAEHDGNETLEVCEERFPTPVEKKTFDALYLILANVVPLAGITYASVQIVLMLLRSQKRITDHSKGRNAPPTEENTAKKSKAVNTVANPQQKTQVRSNPSSSNQVRAAKSVVAVATIFIFCWFTHLILRIYSNFRNSILAVKLTSFIGASYTCFVPYVYLHGVKKLNCSWR
ncbi:alpha-1A adrenergic receptor-like [Sinocyclocheilus anshuiensis]|uniref:alpha-1A adrenergic receptor-like n=1 Tax=Sinocyclocheilus anshuiensis TaxID=1608454 RepID=UPI0007BA2465|nr:PREDICTED: alpha-1A adrenergic receptor-like [Sinocyclocheilus anshuiensis]